MRFRVENGVVTVLAVDGRKVEIAPAADGAEPRRTDVRAALAAELKTLLDAAERDRANAAATW